MRDSAAAPSAHWSWRPSRSELTLAFLVLVPMIAAAQQTAPGQPEGVLFGDIPLITGASRFSQDADEAPASVTVIQADEIARQGWRTLAEVLQSVRGFSISSDRDYTYVGVRGFGQPGDFNTRVLLLLDGQRINENVGGGVFFGTESLVELDLVDWVEVIRGPGSSLYGTGAFFAVVNVVTKRGRAYRGGEVAGALQTAGGRQGRLTLGTRFPSGVEVLASGSLYRRAGDNLYIPEFDDPATNFGRTTHGQLDQRAHGLLKLSRGPLTLLSDYSRRVKHIATASYGSSFNDPRATTADQSLLVALQYAPTVGDRAQLHTALSYNSYDNDGRYPTPDLLAATFLKGQWWIAEGNLALRLGQTQQLVVGGDYQRNTRQSQGLSDVTSGTVFFHNNHRGDNWAAFAQDEIRLTPRVLVNAGLRYDHYATFGGTFNPRVGLIYHHAGSAVKLLAGRAFRAPNNFERYFADGLTQKDNLALQPEDIWSLEAVVDRQLSRRWRISLSGYQNRIRNLITLTTDPADSLRVFRNIGSVDARGLELETEGDIVGFNLRASYALQRAKDGSTGEDVPNSPHHVAKVNLSRAVLRDRLTLGAEVHLLSQRATLTGSEIPGAAVVNLSLRTLQWPRGVSAGLSLFNLFDTRYSDPGSEEHLQPAIEQDGRGLRATLQLGF